MNRRQFLTFAFCAGVSASAIFIAGLAAQTPAPAGKGSTQVAKDLAQYIQDGRKLGLKDDELRASAIRTGWKPNLVDEALKASPPIEAPAPSKSEREDRGVPEEYIIGEADVLAVIVYKEPDASAAPVVVQPNGKVSLPFVKDVVVSGLTPAQAEKLITEKLKPFIEDPDVNVIVREVHSKRIYLVGALRRQGPVDLHYPMTVLQAITEAGGPNEFAKRSKIFVRRSTNGQTFQMKFDYDAVLRGDHQEQNVWLQPGDYIVVPQ